MVVAIKLETRYVIGLTRYMKIQNLGSVDGPARTPQNAYIMMKTRVATAAAMSSLEIPAIRRCARELANRNKVQMSRKARKPRVETVSVTDALR
jgi:hypothetical protein